MRKLVMTAALGCLALATAADAQVARARSTACAYGGPDSDTVFELARLELRSWSSRTLA